MKFEIDLNDILGDENGSETLQESIRRQVVDSVTQTVKKGIGTQIDQAIETTISTAINKYLTKEMPKLLATIMDAEYTPVDRYGDRNKPTSSRKELVRSITENMVYRKTTYSGDKNAFTRAVDEVIEQNLKAFQSEFNKQIDSQFTAAAMEYASNALKKRLGIVV
jgi:hypothetical protein